MTSERVEQIHNTLHEAALIVTGDQPTANLILEKFASLLPLLAADCKDCERMHDVLISILRRVEANPMEAVGITGLAVELRRLLESLPDYSVTTVPKEKDGLNNSDV